MGEITILIRTSYRPEQFARALASVNREICEVIVGFDDEEALDYIPADIESIFLPKTGEEFGYNRYCDELRAKVMRGYYMFLDDDDVMIPGALEQVLATIDPEQHGCIVPFLRDGWQKPNKAKMRRRVLLEGHIGLPSIILRADTRHFGHFFPMENADYQFIQQCTEILDLQWIDIPVVSSQERQKGRMENKFGSLTN